MQGKDKPKTAGSSLATHDDKKKEQAAAQADKNKKE